MKYAIIFLEMIFSLCFLNAQSANGYAFDSVISAKHTSLCKEIDSFLTFSVIDAQKKIAVTNLQQDTTKSDYEPIMELIATYQADQSEFGIYIDKSEAYLEMLKESDKIIEEEAKKFELARQTMPKEEQEKTRAYLTELFDLSDVARKGLEKNIEYFNSLIKRAQSQIKELNKELKKIGK
jgi:hypothetical protein